MASVVFLRGVNVGGHRTLRPAVIAKELAAIGVTSVGAAGTFVVRTGIPRSQLRAEFLRKLPFEAEMMICPAGEIIALANCDPFGDWYKSVGDDVRRSVTVLTRRPRTIPRLPLDRPAEGPWMVRVIAIRGRYVLSLRRRFGGRMLYPNEVIEKCLGVPATTRDWSTVLNIAGILA